MPLYGHPELALHYSVCKEVDLFVCWSILLKIDGDLWFLKDDRFSSGNVIMAKIYERLLSTNILREKRQELLDPQRENLLGKDSISIVNWLEIPRVIVFFSFYMIALPRFFQRRSFVLSSEHENQNVATIRTLLDQFMLSCK